MHCHFNLVHFVLHFIKELPYNTSFFLLAIVIVESLIVFYVYNVQLYELPSLDKDIIIIIITIIIIIIIIKLN